MFQTQCYVSGTSTVTSLDQGRTHCLLRCESSRPLWPVDTMEMTSVLSHSGPEKRQRYFLHVFPKFMTSFPSSSLLPVPGPPACWEVEDSESPLGRGPPGLHRSFVISLRSTRSHWCGCWWRVCDRFRKTEPWEQELKSKRHSINLYSDIKALGYEPDNFLQSDLFFFFFRLLNLAN